MKGVLEFNIVIQYSWLMYSPCFLHWFIFPLHSYYATKRGRWKALPSHISFINLLLHMHNSSHHFQTEHMTWKATSSRGISERGILQYMVLCMDHSLTYWYFHLHTNFNFIGQKSSSYYCYFQHIESTQAIIRNLVHYTISQQFGKTREMDFIYHLLIHIYFHLSFHQPNECLWHPAFFITSITSRGSVRILMFLSFFRLTAWKVEPNLFKWYYYNINLHIACVHTCIQEWAIRTSIT